MERVGEEEPEETRKKEAGSTAVHGEACVASSADGDEDDKSRMDDEEEEDEQEEDEQEEDELDEDEEEHYEGEKDEEGRPHGIGTITLQPSGTVFKGEFAHGERYNIESRCDGIDGAIEGEGRIREWMNVHRTVCDVA